MRREACSSELAAATKGHCCVYACHLYLASFYASGPVKLFPILFGVSCRNNLFSFRLNPHHMGGNQRNQKQHLWSVIGPVSDREGFGTAYRRLTKCFRQNRRTPNAQTWQKVLTCKKKRKPASSQERSEATPRCKGILWETFRGSKRVFPTRKESGSCLCAWTKGSFDSLRLLDGRAETFTKHSHMPSLPLNLHAWPPKRPRMMQPLRKVFGPLKVSWPL